MTDVEVGWITDEGIWVVTGDHADALPLGAAVVEIADGDGRPVTAKTAKVLVDVALDGSETEWVGTLDSGEGLVADHLYRVHFPAPYGRENGVRPACTRRVFEARLALAPVA